MRGKGQTQGDTRKEEVGPVEGGKGSANESIGHGEEGKCWYESGFELVLYCCYNKSPSI